MGRTIGRKWQGHRNPPWLCDKCGAKWSADKLVRDADGLLCCPDDRERSRRELSQINAASARAYAQRFHPARRP